MVDVAVANEARKLARGTNCRRVAETEHQRRGRALPVVVLPRHPPSRMREPYITIRISVDRLHDSRGKNCIVSDKPDVCIVVRLAQDKSFGY